MKIIKKLALCALFANVAYSAELPVDHPIKTAVQMAKLVFLQYPIPISQIHHGTGCHTAKLGIDNNLLLIQKTVTDNFKVCVDTLFSNEDRVGGGITSPVLSHHRTCDVAYGGFNAGFTQLSSYVHQA